jgi:hypothetical protein
MVVYHVLHGQQVFIGTAGTWVSPVHVAVKKTVEYLVSEVFYVAIEYEMIMRIEHLQLLFDEQPPFFLTTDMYY